MANPWFRMYHEFATDPKVQMLSESDQRRYIMLLCLRCCNDGETLQDEEVAFQLRVSDEEFARTKQLLIGKGLIDEYCNPVAWNKRQFASDSSTARVKAYRERNRRDRQQGCNVTVTPPDTDTDTDSDTDTTAGAVAAPPTPPPPPPDDTGTSKPIPAGWQPDTETLARIAQHNIPEWFTQDLVPEFVLYWRERNASARTWGTKFMNHALRKWREHEARAPAPRRIDPEWSPEPRTLEALEAAGIEKSFAESLVPEFVIYWHESQRKCATWNAKFIRLARQQWENFKSGKSVSTRDLSLQEQLSDRSWAGA